MPRLRLDPTSSSGVAIAPDDTPRQSYGYVSNKVTGLISAGTNITLTGNGTDSSPYVISSSGGGGGTTLPTDAAGWLHDNGSGTLAWTTPVKADVGLGNVDNTSDANKPVSTAQQTALDLKAPLASPTFTGTPGFSGSSGVLSIYANPDGGEYNIGASASGKLAIFGSAGNTLDLNLLDGAFYTASVVRLSNAGVLQNVDLTGTGNTFPTFNQSTTGSAAKWTTARNLAGNSVDGSANVAFANKFIVQGTADSGLSAAQFLGALSTGILKVTTTTGVLSTAVAADFPTLNQNTTGSAATLTTARTIDGQSFDGSANVTVIAPGTHAATSKTTPVDADELPLVDSAASNVLKKLTWANLKATIKSYYDSVASTLTNKDLTSTTNTFPNGMVVQVVSTNYSAVATGTTVIPNDDTIPQITEGVQFMSQAITPKSTTNKLVIEVVMAMGISSNGNRIAALFQDSTANALAATRTYVGNFGDPVIITMRHTMTAGTTSATTFTVRGGSETAGTWTFNGSGGSRTLGGATLSNITITEYKA